MQRVLLVVAKDLKDDGLRLNVVNEGLGHSNGDLRRGRERREGVVMDGVVMRYCCLLVWRKGPAKRQINER